jgi:pimeloyl-ACP methyl ester carboxylesterase
MTADTPTIVFVHGAWADASGWARQLAPCATEGSTPLVSPTRFTT